MALGAQKNGYDVHIATPVSEHIHVVESKGFNFHPIPLNRSRINPFAEIKTFFALYRLYKRVCPDIVHHVTIKPVLYGGIADRLAGVHGVVSAISGLGFVFVSSGVLAQLRRFLVKQIYKFALGHNNLKVIFQNPDDCSLFIKSSLIDPNQAVLIRGSGVDTDFFIPFPEPDAGPFVVVMACRMLWNKGVKEFVCAAKQLKKKRIHARFVLVGDIDTDNPGSVPAEKLHKWDRERIIEWWGFKENMREIFRISHIVCLPSYYGEGIPKVLIEAASCGRAVVTTDMPGCREIVRHNKNGLLVPEKNPEALADAILKLVKKPDLRKKMGEYGRKYVESDFRVESVVSKTLDVYEKCRLKKG